MATVTVKTTTVRENGEGIYQARVYKGSKREATVNLRGGGFSSQSAYNMALGSLRGIVSDLQSDGDTLKVEAGLNRDLQLTATEI